MNFSRLVGILISCKLGVLSCNFCFLSLQTSEKSLRELFGQKGTVTDCSLKYAPNGQFRRFAFIGYKTEQEAQDAQKYFDKTFVRSARIKVCGGRKINDLSNDR